MVRSISIERLKLMYGPELSRLAELERDPGHYIDLTDDGKAMGIVPLGKLPVTREAYDTQLGGLGSLPRRRTPESYAGLNGPPPKCSEFTSAFGV